MKIDIQPITYVFLGLLLLSIPLPWLVGWLTAIGFHELCHWIAVKMCGGEIYNITIGINGANMECSTLPNTKRLFCVLCGPIGGLLLLFLVRWMPRVAICSFALSIYNLIPVLPLDGGQAMQMIIKNNRVFYALEMVIIAIMTIGAIYCGMLLHWGLFPAAVIGGLLVRRRKTPCKDVSGRVQ